MGGGVGGGGGRRGKTDRIHRGRRSTVLSITLLVCVRTVLVHESAQRSNETGRTKMIVDDAWSPPSSLPFFFTV